MKKKIFWAVCFAIMIAGIAFAIFRFTAPKVIDIVPKDKTVDMSPDKIVNIVFNRNLSDWEKSGVVIKVSPQTNIDSSWAGKQLNIAAKGGFKTKTVYNIEVDYRFFKLSSFSFTTVDYTAEELRQQINQQYAGDRAFDQSFTGEINNNPWIMSLPIENSNYRIVYDYNEKSFRIRILVSVDSTQKQKLINQALADLKKIGVTTTPIPYYVLP